AGRVEVQVRDDPCHPDRMKEVWFPTPATLVTVSPLCVGVRSLNQGRIRLGMIRSDAIYEGLNARDHRARFRTIFMDKLTSAGPTAKTPPAPSPGPRAWSGEVFPADTVSAEAGSVHEGAVHEG